MKSIQLKIFWLLNKLQQLIMMFTPDKYKLVVFCRLKYFLESREAELENLDKLVLLKKNSRTALDIGANIGEYSYRMSKIFQQVYSFEINNSLYSFIEKSEIKNLKLEKYGLSNFCGNTTMHLPLSAKGDILSGWVSLEKRDLEDIKDFLIKETAVKTLDSLNIKNIDLIKIDVEGHENNVLVGGINTIKNQRPLIILETDPENIEAFLEEFFEKIDYKLLKLNEILPTAKASYQNWIALPKELKPVI